MSIFFIFIPAAFVSNVVLIEPLGWVFSGAIDAAVLARQDDGAEARLVTPVSIGTSDAPAETAGLFVKDLRYFASQSWPFPHSLMIAFVCEYASGELKPQEAEIEDAKWFDLLQLPKLPSKISIARRLIDAVCQEIRKQT